jgi:hypothetical protein
VETSIRLGAGVIWLLTLPLLVGGYIGYIWLVAWFEVKALPRAETFMCDKHGPMQKEYTITFAGVPYCSMCFHEKLSVMEKIPGSNGTAQ